MANLFEIKRAINCIKKYTNKITILYCVSGYPSKEQDINLNSLKKLKKILKIIILDYQITLMIFTHLLLLLLLV